MPDSLISMLLPRCLVADDSKHGVRILVLEDFEGRKKVRSDEKTTNSKLDILKI